MALAGCLCDEYPYSVQRRKRTLNLDPNAAQSARLEAWTRLHCELYNAALEERIDDWRKAKKSINYLDQQNALPQIKADRPVFVELGSHALQQTLHGLDLAFAAIFQRVKAGQTPGFRASNQPTASRVSPIPTRLGVWRHCGHVMPRDQNSAWVVLIDAHNMHNAPGTGVAARPKPLPRQRGKSKSLTRETPTTTGPAVSRRESSFDPVRDRPRRSGR